MVAAAQSAIEKVLILFIVLLFYVILFVVGHWASFLHCHRIFALCLLVLSLGTGDTPLAQVLVAANMRVGKSAILLEQDGNRH